MAASSETGRPLCVGILALQGGVEEHRRALQGAGAHVRTVRRAADLDGLEGLVIPGGESSVIDKLARALDLAEPLRQAISGGLPTLATCAGLIYLAREVVDKAPGQESLGLIDVAVRRNAFGRQVDSFDTTIEIDGYAVPVSFIRAPEVVRVGDGVEVIARTDDGKVVGVRNGAITALACHPESSEDFAFHARWIKGLRLT